MTIRGSCCFRGPLIGFSRFRISMHGIWIRLIMWYVGEGGRERGREGGIDWRDGKE